MKLGMQSYSFGNEKDLHRNSLRWSVRSAYLIFAASSTAGRIPPSTNCGASRKCWKSSCEIPSRSLSQWEHYHEKKESGGEGTAVGRVLSPAHVHSGDQMSAQRRHLSRLPALPHHHGAGIPKFLRPLRPGPGLGRLRGRADRLGALRPARQTRPLQPAARTQKTQESPHQ